MASPPNRTVAIVPVKRLDAAKQRLSAALAPAARHTLARAMLADVLAALDEVEELDALVVVTADPTVAADAGKAGAEVVHDPRESGQSAAAAIGIAHARERGCRRALLLPGDTPLLDAADVVDLLVRAAQRTPCVAIVSDRHGRGTNALLLDPPGAIEPSFGPDSFDRHLRACRERDVDHVELAPRSLTLDVDTPEDFEQLERALADTAAGAHRTRVALRGLERVTS